jgi:HPr kinase/phosphorylase
MIRYHMEIRGLGILNIQELFGISAVCSEKDLDLVVDLVPWEEGREYDRLGLDESRYSVLDVEVPYLQIPVAPGRNMASVVEVAARNHLLKSMGYNSAIRLRDRLDQKLREGSS